MRDDLPEPGADEWWGVTDATGASLNRVTPRAAPEFGPGEFHAVVGTVVLADDGSVLVTRRSPEKTHPGKWEFPAGSALAGESSVDAACRELAEETGIEVPASALVRIGTVLQPPQRFEVFGVRVGARPRVVPQPGEVDGFAWVSPGAVFASASVAAVGADADSDTRVDFAGPWLERIEALAGEIATFCGVSHGVDRRASEGRAG